MNQEKQQRGKKNRGYQRGRDNIGGDKEGEKSMK